MTLPCFLGCWGSVMVSLSGADGCDVLSDKFIRSPAVLWTCWRTRASVKIGLHSRWPFWRNSLQHFPIAYSLKTSISQRKAFGSSHCCHITEGGRRASEACPQSLWLHVIYMHSNFYEEMMEQTGKYIKQKNNTEKQISKWILFQLSTYLNCRDVPAQQILEVWRRNGLVKEEESSEI